MSKNLWVTDADRAQQGSFCDTTSKIHYDNFSRNEMDNAIAVAQEYGSDVTDLRDERDVMVVDNSQMKSAKVVAARNNCTILEVDSQTFDYPAKHGPGN
ncbi:MAG: hypothetical protein F6K31_17005 [Symploca sp. SIO2G7]|nr:hypothetical protein [Symploca sp. SIO2G7]